MEALAVAYGTLGTAERWLKTTGLKYLNVIE